MFPIQISKVIFANLEGTPTKSNLSGFCTHLWCMSPTRYNWVSNPVVVRPRIPGLAIRPMSGLTRRPERIGGRRARYQPARITMFATTVRWRLRSRLAWATIFRRNAATNATPRPRDPSTTNGVHGAIAWPIETNSTRFNLPGYRRLKGKITNGFRPIGSRSGKTRCKILHPAKGKGLRLGNLYANCLSRFEWLQ